MTDVDLVPVEPSSRAVAPPPWLLLSYAGIGVKTPALAVEVVGHDQGGFIDGGAYYTGDFGRVDANGMLYLL
jgi:hypothetical protein